jgi:hypothetical protein
MMLQRVMQQPIMELIMAAVAAAVDVQQTETVNSIIL